MPTPALVWIVDDDEDDQYLFELAFKQLVPPVVVKLLQDGEDLLPTLVDSTQLPQLIILDLNMPRLNGFDALRQVRQHPAFERVPIIVLTTSSQLEDQRKAEELGANGFLTKPPSMEALLVLFAQLVQDWELG